MQMFQTPVLSSYSANSSKSSMLCASTDESPKPTLCMLTAVDATPTPTQPPSHPLPPVPSQMRVYKQ